MLTKSRWISPWCLLYAIAFCATAQVTQIERTQIPISQDAEAYNVIPADTAGIILYRNFKASTENQLEVTCLDTALQTQWKGYVPVLNSFSFASAKVLGGKVYFFYNGWPERKEFLVLAMRIKDGVYSSISVKNFIAFNATEFVVTKEAILIGGYFNFRPIVLHYSFKERRSRMLPGFLNEPGELTQIKPYPDGNVDVIVSARNNSRRKSIWIRHFDPWGDLEKTVILEPEENKTLIFGRAAKANNGNQVIAGVYGSNSSYARGIFVAEVNDYGEYAIHYYSFADLQNFFHYMKAKREKRIKERIERRKIKGKKTKFNYRFLVHELIPYKDQFILLGEAFYLRYSSRTNYSGIPMYGNNYSPWTYNLSNRINSPYRSDYVFDGFQYTHAIAIGFDKNANLIWDNSFEINGIKSFQLEQFVKILPRKEHIVLVYQFENLIRSKIIKDNQVIEGTTQNDMKPQDGQALVKNTTHLGKLEYWYGSYFLSSGIQNVKDNDFTRKVFFINKLSAH